jgi:hypothetical protein
VLLFYRGGASGGPGATRLAPLEPEPVVDWPFAASGAEAVWLSLELLYIKPPIARAAHTASTDHTAAFVFGFGLRFGSFMSAISSPFRESKLKAEFYFTPRLPET